MDVKPYPAQQQPSLVAVAMAIRAAQRAGECHLEPIDLALVLCVASEEHTLNRARVPTFTPAEIATRLGVAKLDTVYSARKRAVAAGWLHYEHRARQPGAYWVLVPAMFHDAQPIPFGGVHPVQRDRSAGCMGKGSGMGSSSQKKRSSSCCSRAQVIRGGRGQGRRRAP